jgi:hypothetical protein
MTILTDNQFTLNANKRPKQSSSGTKKRYNLASPISHRRILVTRKPSRNKRSR